MREDPLQDERLRLREDAKRLLRVSYERQTAQGGGVCGSISGRGPRSGA
jgi:hypothetical protein